MSDRVQRITAPVIILIIMLIAWEGVVSLFDIKEFLLPRPTVILSNLGRVFILDKAISQTNDEVEALLNKDYLVTVLPAFVPFKLSEEIEATKLYQFSLNQRTIMLLRGKNLIPILQASWFTLKEALGGFIIGCSLGILTALATARWTASREALMPFAIAANSMPIIAFAPIMNNWFGIDNPFSKMAVVAIMTFFPMMINTVRGLTTVDAHSLELMRSYAASNLDILLKLRVPNSLPYLFSGFKVAAALSMIGAIVGEYFGGPRIALGVFITQEAALFRFSSAWAAIIIACILGITFYLLISLAERLAMPWYVSFR